MQTCITLLQVKERKADTSTAQFSLNRNGAEMKEEQGNKEMAGVEIKEHQQKV